ncbi:MAG: DAK2 domain-containing protein [Clostridia bacterium]|nr:DAK2 domain-containing protein [Clostridia bacterium]
MMVSGANNLYNNKKSVDDLNVFPVPDGDTGTNMSLTSRAMAKALEEHVSLSLTKIADEAANATLRGARGNSGVILSQFYRGMSKCLKGKDSCTGADFAQALKEGSDTAYKAVMNPTEGTILTVAKEAAAGAMLAAQRNLDMIEILEEAVRRGKRALDKTPDMLPALKRAGVVDAGGQGWIYILEGALYFLKNNEVIPCKEEPYQGFEKLSKAQQKISPDNIKYMYCTEFIVEKKNKNVNVMAFRNSIETKGDSMVVIDDEDIVKVHIHTNHPGFVLERAVMLGSMINIKIDNMKHQHQSLIQTGFEEKTVSPSKKYGFISVCSGDGLVGIFKDLGIDKVIEGGQTMNPSTDDILSAASEVNAENIFVFPNNKNIILAANQAKELSDKNIVVIPTKSIPECIAAMLAYSESASLDENESAMNKAKDMVKTGQITYAVRDTEASGKQIKNGDILGIVGGEIAVTGNNPEEVCSNVTLNIADDDTEFITVYYGSDVSKEQAEELEKVLEKQHPNAEISVKYGGQPVYYYIVSAE